MNKFQIVKSFFSFLLKQKKYWLLPIVIALVLLGIVVVLGEGSAVAPFIYSLF